MSRVELAGTLTLVVTMMGLLLARQVLVTGAGGELPALGQQAPSQRQARRVAGVDRRAGVRGRR